MIFHEAENEQADLPVVPATKVCTMLPTVNG